MRTAGDVSIDDVLGFYDGNRGEVVALVMGEQAHIGGLAATLALADLANIGDGQNGIDLGCNQGAAMRALIQLRGVASMIGVDMSAAMLERATHASTRFGFQTTTRFVKADVRETGLDDAAADFVWGEDAWAYVEDKPRVITEAVRLIRRGGVIAFSDWVEGPAGLSELEADQFMHAMHFPSVASVDDYVAMLSASDCDVDVAEYSSGFGECNHLYATMLETQFRFDALQMLDFDEDDLTALTAGFRWLAEMGDAGKVSQARFVARRRA